MVKTDQPVSPMRMSDSYRAGVTFYDLREAKMVIRGLGPSWAFHGHTVPSQNQASCKDQDLCFMVLPVYPVSQGLQIVSDDWDRNAQK